MEISAGDRKRIDRLTGAVDRLASILEKVTELAQEEQKVDFVPLDPAPPACPQCGQVNPTILVDIPGGRGCMAEFVLTAQCTNCNTVIYALPTDWAIGTDLSDIKEIQAERKAGWEDGT